MTSEESAADGAQETPAHHTPTANEAGPEDTSGIADMVEEGAPLEPVDIDEVDAGSEEAGPAGPSLEEQLAERTSDLQRLQAEYANYRKRVERDRQLTVENATFKALVPIIDVLDTIDRARESARSMESELDAGFSTVADQLARAAAGAGLIRFGEPGDEFDPNLHEALSHMGTDAEVEVTTCKHIAKAGYRIGDRVVRAAQVLVVDPADA